MQKAALWHVCRAPFAYPVGEAHVRLVLLGARGDLAGATVVFGDRYTRPPEGDAQAAMGRLGSDDRHDYWGVTIPVPTRRLRYKIRAEGAEGQQVWLTDAGLAPTRQAGPFFEFPYLHRNDRFEQPAWLRETVFYQIFPDRFCNGDPENDPPGTAPWGTKPTSRLRTGGDLAGIRQKLDYLTDLGVNGIYTTPIFAAPSNHKYDTADYYAIDPAFGGAEDLIALVREAHARGMRVLLDGVFNHAGRDWFAFRDVIARGAESPYRDWFYDLGPFPVDPARCRYETFANRVPSMPKLDTGNPDCAAYLLDVAGHWTEIAGVDGWRLDVANEVDRRFWRSFRERVKSLRPDAFLLGEVWHDPTEWLNGDTLDGVTNYPWRAATLAFLKGDLDAASYDALLCRLRFRHTAAASRGLVNLLGSHDTPRVRTELGGSSERAAQAAVLLLTAPGVPLIPYGDEIGMEGAGDPDCRRCYPWDDPRAQDHQLFRIYRRLLAIRRAFPWLQDGAWETLIACPQTGLLGYRRLPTPLETPERPRQEEGLIVVVNRAPSAACAAVPEGGEQIDLLRGCRGSGRIEGGSRLLLPPHGIAVLAPPALAGRLTERV